MHPLTGRVLERADTQGIVGRRRSNYAYLAEALGREGPGGLFVPEFPELPEGACPFLFPVRVVRGDVRKVHEALVEMGIPIAVFPERPHPSLSREEFPRGHELADSLLCLPCHQDVSVRGMDAMLGIMRAVASSGVG
jgi:dTDP-4-amino-4,6-dideoxygalactose transaminase